MQTDHAGDLGGGGDVGPKFAKRQINARVNLQIAHVYRNSRPNMLRVLMEIERREEIRDGICKNAAAPAMGTRVLGI